MRVAANCGGGGRCRVLPSMVTAGGISSDTATLAPPLLMVRRHPPAAGLEAAAGRERAHCASLRLRACSMPRGCRVMMAAGHYMRGQSNQCSRRLVPGESPLTPTGNQIRVLV